jgi:hypothetical protein
MNNNTLKKLIKEEIRSILKEGEHDQQNYMFFQNLHTIKRMVEKMLALNPQEVDALLSDGHGWAVDHISTSADDVGEVGTWMCNELGRDMNNTNMMSESNSNNDIANYIITLSNRLTVAKQEGDQKMIDTLTKWIADLKNELKNNKSKGIKEANLGHNESASIHQEGNSWIVAYKNINGTQEKVFKTEKEAREFFNKFK